MLIARGEKSSVRPAVTGRNAETLARANHDIGSTFSGRLEEREREKISGNDRERSGAVNAGDEFFQITNRAVGGGVLKERGKEGFGGRIFGRASEDLDAKRLGAGLENREGLRMDMIRDEDGITALDVMAESHRLGSGGGFVEQRGIGNLHSSEVANHGLEIQKRLKPTLRDLGLIGCVGGIPTGVLENISADHGRGVRAVDAHAEVVRGDFVFRHDGAEVGEGFFLGARGG